MTNQNVDVFLMKAVLGSRAGEFVPLGAKNRRVSEVGRNFVRMYTAQLLGVKFDSLTFSKNAYGKPYFEDCDVKFNISHCGNVILVAIGRQELGVDIESVSRSGNAIVQRNFDYGERNYIACSRNAIEEGRRFAEIWTAKEAVLKREGTGLSGRMNFAVADGSGPLASVALSGGNRVELFHKSVTLPMGEGDFLPKRVNVRDMTEAEFHLCVCAEKLGEVNFEILE